MRTSTIGLDLLENQPDTRIAKPKKCIYTATQRCELVSRSQTAFLVKAVWLRETRCEHLSIFEKAVNAHVFQKSLLSDMNWARRSQHT